ESRRTPAAWRSFDRSHTRRRLSRTLREGYRHFGESGRDDFPCFFLHTLYDSPVSHEAPDRACRIPAELRSPPAAAAASPAAARAERRGRTRPISRGLREDASEPGACVQRPSGKRKTSRDYAETESDWFWTTGPEHDFTYFSDHVDAFGVDSGHLIG